MSSMTKISIHALLAESDRLTSWSTAALYQNFNPRSPCGERPRHDLHLFPRYGFQSTLSLRRATTLTASGWSSNTISIHALLAESDVAADFLAVEAQLFQSTLSLRRATRLSRSSASLRRFQSTLSLRRATLLRGHPLHGIHISIHALLAESDSSLPLGHPGCPISIHALLAESDPWTW